MTKRNVQADLTNAATGFGDTPLTVFLRLQDAVEGTTAFEEAEEAWCWALIVVGTVEEQTKVLRGVLEYPDFHLLESHIVAAYGLEKWQVLKNQLTDQIKGGL